MSRHPVLLRALYHTTAVYHAPSQEGKYGGDSSSWMCDIAVRDALYLVISSKYRGSASTSKDIDCEDQGGHPPSSHRRYS